MENLLMQSHKNRQEEVEESENENIIINYLNNIIYIFLVTYLIIYIILLVSNSGTYGRLSNFH